VGSNPTLSAIQSRDAETSRIYSESDREKPAIPRGFGRSALWKGTGDRRFGAQFTSRRTYISVAMFGGSLSRSIRVSDGQDSGEQSWLHDSRSAAAFHVRELGALRAFLSRTRAAPFAPPNPVADRPASSALVS
jgi:hypothetical protein